jgi:3-dehydroquinate dehydratase type I
MICVSIAEATFAETMEAVRRFPLAEIRMDAMRLTPDDVRRLFSGHDNLVATFRAGTATDGEREALLAAAIESGAAYVDIELASDSAYRQRLVRKAREHGCTVIISFHDYRGTPEREGLKQVVGACFAEGADIAKVACAVQSDRDAARLLGLLDDGRQIIVVGMGAKGRIVRLAAPLLGSPFTYAAIAPGRETAEGQMTHGSLTACMDAVEKALQEGQQT